VPAWLAVALSLDSLPVSPETGSLDLNARIRGSCKIERIKPVDFGDIQQDGRTSRTVSAAVTFWCSKGLAYRIDIGRGTSHSGTVRRMRGEAAENADELLPYELVAGSAISGNGRGPLAAEVLALEAVVRTSDYDRLGAGTLRDQVVVTISAHACCANFAHVDVIARRPGTSKGNSPKR
jgi:spore coat protein U-like protein